MDSYLSQIENHLGVIPSVEELQDRYEFHYYSSFSKAVADTNNQTTNNADSTQDDAIAAIYDKDNEKVIVLMKDITESTQLTIDENTTINLGGHLLSSTDSIALTMPKNAGITLNIDGRLPGSGISIENSGMARNIVLTEGNTLIINGGTYTAKGTNATAGVYTNKNSNLTISNVSIDAKSSQAQAFGIYSFGFDSIKNSTINISGNSGASMAILVNQKDVENKVVGVIDNVKIQASSDIGNSVGIWNSTSSEIVIQNTNIFTDATDNDSSKLYGLGIENHGILHFHSGSVGGTIAGLAAYSGSKTYITGGEFYSCSHGGIYFAQGENGEAYVSNATISCVEYAGKYDATKFTNSQLGGFYIGDTTNANVYMDKCTIRGGSKAFVLRGTDTGTNNKLYISNSTIGDNQIRIDNETLRVYIGKGNNITTDKIDHPEWSEFTNEEYSPK